MDLGRHIVDSSDKPQQLYSIVRDTLLPRIAVFMPLSTLGKVSPGYIDAPGVNVWDDIERWRRQCVSGHVLPPLEIVSGGARSELLHTPAEQASPPTVTYVISSLEYYDGDGSANGGPTPGWQSKHVPYMRRSHLRAALDWCVRRGSRRRGVTRLILSAESFHSPKRGSTPELTK